jgi:hypothetical protein
VTNERLRQIECLYHAALEHDESECEVFLDAACGPDEDLRQEVDSLLFYSRHSENFLESSALETVAKKLANEESCEQTRHPWRLSEPPPFPRHWALQKKVIPQLELFSGPVPTIRSARRLGRLWSAIGPSVDARLHFSA